MFVIFKGPYKSTPSITNRRLAIYDKSLLSSRIRCILEKPTGMAGTRPDSLDLYHVFQSSYNKIAKTEVNDGSETGPYLTASHQLYPTVPRTGSFDGGRHGYGKEKGDGDWFAPGAGESALYSDPAMYYSVGGGAHLHEDWGSFPAYPTDPPPPLTYEEAPFRTHNTNHLEDAINMINNHTDHSQVRRF